MYSRRFDRPMTVYLDQDDALADFKSAAAAAGWEPPVAKMKRGFHRSLPLTPGAREAVEELLSFHHLHVFVATKIPDHNPNAATEKILWLNEQLPGLGERIIITPNKACWEPSTTSWSTTGRTRRRPVASLAHSYIMDRTSCR